MKISEMRTMAIPEAKKQVHDLRSELAKHRAVAAGGTRPENPGKIRGLKKNIARFLTIIKEKEIKEKTIKIKTIEAKDDKKNKEVKTA